MYGDQALALMCSDEYGHLTHAFDIGSGTGEHAEALRSVGKTVFEIDVNSRRAGPWFVCAPVEKIVARASCADMIWCCHCLEHLRNIHLVLDKFWIMLRDGGVLTITVPPAKPEIVGGHLTTWNAGLLLYNLVVAGFDCRKARIKTYGYNISVIVTRSHNIRIPELLHDHGDIERLAHLFPPELNVKQGFDGNIGELNWWHGRS